MHALIFNVQVTPSRTWVHDAARSRYIYPGLEKAWLRVLRTLLVSRGPPKE